jgi:hypothetical protein
MLPRARESTSVQRYEDFKVGREHGDGVERSCAGVGRG